MPTTEVKYADVARNTGMLEEDIIPTFRKMKITSKRMGKPSSEEKMRSIVEGLRPNFEAKRWIAMEKLDIESHPVKKLKNAPKKVIYGVQVRH